MSSIPERLWDVVCGHWELARERMGEDTSVADAYNELAEHIRNTPVEAAPTTQQPGAAPRLAQPAPSPPGGRDPFAVSYELLGIRPGVSIPELEAGYQARLAELKVDQYPEGSAQRQVIEGRRQAVSAAYEKLRDALNPTETRFERIEF